MKRHEIHDMTERAGEIIRVRYLGGTQPGTTRDLQIHRIEDEYISAQCLASGMVKSFRLDRLQIVSDDTPLTYTATPPLTRGKRKPAAAASKRMIGRMASRWAAPAPPRGVLSRLEKWFFRS